MAVAIVAEPGHSPINDASFVQKEQPNGNLSCIESATEMIGVGFLSSWRVFTDQPWQQRVKSKEDSDTITLLHPLLCQLLTPSPQAKQHSLKSQAMPRSMLSLIVLSQRAVMGQPIWCQDCVMSRVPLQSMWRCRIQRKVGYKGRQRECRCWGSTPTSKGQVKQDPQPHIPELL